MKTLDPIIKNYEKKLDELAGLSWAGASGVSTADIPDLSRTRECFDGDMYLLDNPIFFFAISFIILVAIY